MFVGSDWQGTDKWNKIEEELSKMRCRAERLLHEDGINSPSFGRNKSVFFVFLIDEEGNWACILKSLYFENTAPNYCKMPH